MKAMALPLLLSPVIPRQPLLQDWRFSTAAIDWAFREWMGLRDCNWGYGIGKGAGLKAQGARGKARKLKAERVKSWEVRKLGSYKA
jgi:hypothetical protein